MENNTILQGDCIEEMKKLQSNSVDAIITDPPYGLQFMGKEWDTFKEYNEEPQTERTKRIRYYKPDGTPVYWFQPTYLPKNFKFIGKNQRDKNELMENFFYIFGIEAIRVLKPGGFMLVMGGTRTYHRMTCGIEDAGFEIRDTIMWLYGSGFPKSLNIGKQIDKNYNKTSKELIKFGELIREHRDNKGISQRELGKRIGASRELINLYEIKGNIQQQFPTKEFWLKIKEELKIPNEKDYIYEEAKREVIGKNNYTIPKEVYNIGEEKSGERAESLITTPATQEAKQWEGWGTALKPACEPIVVARKPLSEKNVALNVLKHGTGGMNIDESRIGYKSEYDKSQATPQGKCTSGTDERIGAKPNVENQERQDFKRPEPQGRFPSNIILECTCDNFKCKDCGSRDYPYHEEFCTMGELGWEKFNVHTEPNCPCYMLDEQSGESKSSKVGFDNVGWKHSGNTKEEMTKLRYQQEFNDKGGASRFFYCAKASKSERNFGLENEPEKERAVVTDFRPTVKSNPENWQHIDKYPNMRTTPMKNNHPTVKPIKLMEYLIKLVSPIGGTILDPFIGSGTTAIACIKLNRQFIGIEKEEEYVKIANARIKPYLEQTKL